MPNLSEGLPCCRRSFQSLALLIAGLFGELLLHEYGIPLPVLALSAGIIVFLVALLNILQQFALPTSQSEGPVGPTSDHEHGVNAACLSDDRHAIRDCCAHRLPCI